MAILRDPITYDNTVNYIATLALFCGISCAVIMLRFGGFKASFNLSSGNRIKSEYYEDVPIISDTKGAYRSNREEFFGNGSLSDPPKRIDPSMVKLPQSVRPGPALKPSKSTGNLTQPSSPPSNNASNSSQSSSLHPNKGAGSSTQPSNLRPDVSNSTPNVSMNPQGETANNKDAPKAQNINNKDAKKQLEQQKKLEKKQLDEQKKLEKKRLDEQKKLEKKQLNEQKKRDKLATQERAKQEKESKAKEKQEAQQQAKLAKAKNDKDKGKAKAAPAPTQKARVNPLGKGPSQAVVPTPPPLPPPQPQPSQAPVQTRKQAPTQGLAPRQYSTNTLESSISRTSGPPAYTEAADVVQNQKDNTGNTSFGKPIDDSSSWDMITQHRQQMSRPAVTGGGARKQTVLDLEYTVQTEA